MLPVLWRGFKQQQVNIGYLPTTVPKREESLRIGAILEKHWKEQIDEDPGGKQHPKLFSAILKTHARQISVISILSTLCVSNLNN